MQNMGHWALGNHFHGDVFIGHFGAFMAVHLLFIYGIFIEGVESMGTTVGQVLEDFLKLWPGLLAICISHGISFWHNFLDKQEYLGRSLNTQMTEPYQRIVIMHITIILGAFLVLALNSAMLALLLLISMKIAADVKAHLKQHKHHQDSSEAATAS
jgi:MFS superfamily sulfate permease-like transporter